MKKILLVLVVGFMTLGCPSLFAQHSLEKLWLTDSTSLKNPESVLYDSKGKILYVSNIGAFDQPNTGFISKVGVDGKIVKKDWVTGLNGTKGLGLHKNMLYAAELNNVAVIDTDKGTIARRIPIDGAEMLNDITVDSKGTIYVSDSKKGNIHKIENDKPSLYIDNLKGVNGVLAVGNDLYILADGKFIKSDKDKKMTTIVEGIEGGADGIEKVKDNEFLLTGWAGTIYYVKDGSKEVLSDTRNKKINAADLGYDPSSKTLYIPQMISNRVIAYKLK
jgi:DNA-binding beta-propeller fold protein YncE